MRKLRPGDWVEVLDTENVKEYNSKGIGFQFQITKERIYDKCHHHTTPSKGYIYILLKEIIFKQIISHQI